MRIAEVIGTVTLNRVHPSFRYGTFRLVAPLSLTDLVDETVTEAAEIVVYDELGAGQHSLIAMSEGREAAQPFGKDTKPVDAYNGAILDHLHVDADELHGSGGGIVPGDDTKAR
jgi:ethanolamine utilization protein EutN